MRTAKAVALGVGLVLSSWSVSGAQEVKVDVKAVGTGTYFITFNRSMTERVNDISVGTGIVDVQADYGGLVKVGFVAGLWQIPVVGVEPVPVLPDASGEVGFSVFNAFADVSLEKLGLPVSIQAGRITTNVGGELAFTSQNINIQRGIVWYGEPVFFNGVRLNVNLESVYIYAGAIRGIFDSPDGNLGAEGGVIYSGGDLSVAFNVILSSSDDADAIQLFDLVLGYSFGSISATLYGDLLLDGNFGNPGFAGALLVGVFPGDAGVGLRFEFARTGLADYWGIASDNSLITFTVTPTYKIGKGFLRAEFSLAQSLDKEIYTDADGNPTPTQLRLGVEVGVEF